jgi:hypothetical protein
MKSKRSIIAILVFLTGIMTACSKDDSTTPSSPATVKESLGSGTWRITYFWDTDHEETGHFTGYSFTFGDPGVVAATNGSVDVTGTWSTLTDDSSLKLVLSFANPADFQDLSSDWRIVESTGLKIRLEDVSGGNGGTDYLTFEKN